MYNKLIILKYCNIAFRKQNNLTFNLKYKESSFSIQVLYSRLF